MTVAEFLERVKQSGAPIASINFLMDLLTILDEFDTMPCSVLAGKIRAQTEENAK
jgi:hypothetical protein